MATTKDTRSKAQKDAATRRASAASKAATAAKRARSENARAIESTSQREVVRSGRTKEQATAIAQWKSPDGRCYRAHYPAGDGPACGECSFCTEILASLKGGSASDTETITRALQRLGSAYGAGDSIEEKAQRMFESLGHDVVTEIQDTFPSGRGVGKHEVDKMVALGLCTVIGSRGPFAVDVEWTPLGRRVAALLPPSGEDE